MKVALTQAGLDVSLLDKITSAGNELAMVQAIETNITGDGTQAVKSLLTRYATDLSAAIEEFQTAMVDPLKAVEDFRVRSTAQKSEQQAQESKAATAAALNVHRALLPQMKDSNFILGTSRGQSILAQIENEYVNNTPLSVEQRVIERVKARSFDDLLRFTHAVMDHAGTLEKQMGVQSSMQPGGVNPGTLQAQPRQGGSLGLFSIPQDAGMMAGGVFKTL